MWEWAALPIQHAAKSQVRGNVEESFHALMEQGGQVSEESMRGAPAARP